MRFPIQINLFCLLFVCLIAGVSASRAEEPLTRFEYKEYHMGVDVRIVVYAPDKEKAEQACTAAFERFAELDSIMSDYRADSELMRLCAKAGGPPVKVSPDLFKVLEFSWKASELSGGAFDVTCGPAVALWRKARKTHILPSPEEIKKAVQVMGWRKMRLNPKNRTVQLLVPGMKLDLGGIGKGYADECAQEVLKRFGITSALVEAGGDIVVSGPPPGEEGWKIQIISAPGTPSQILHLVNRAISTSGDKEQFVEIGGKRYSHVLDPRTGEALTDSVQVTIIAKNGMISETRSKMLSVLGPKGILPDRDIQIYLQGDHFRLELKVGADVFPENIFVASRPVPFLRDGSRDAVR